MKTFSEDLTIRKDTFGVAYAYMRPPGIMARPHSHNEIELNLMEQGRLTYLIGSERVEITAGQFVLFWGAVPHQVVAHTDDAILHWLTLPLARVLQWQLPAAVIQPLMHGKCIHMPVDLSDGFQAALFLFQQWRKDLEDGSEERQTIVCLEGEAYLRRLALALAHRQTTGNATPEAPGKALHALTKAEQLASFIMQHYTEEISVNEIARQVHLHPNYAMTLFRAHFGVSLVEYITQYRLAHAQRLLTTTQRTTSEIALEAGFGSVSRFYVAFKQAYGLSPGQYRTSLHLPAPRARNVAGK